MQIKNKKTNNKGITLIALVITIIVLLILAGVAISTLTGDNGILTKAVTAKDKTIEAEAKEAVQLEAIGSIDNTGKFNYENFKTNVKEQLGVQDKEIKDNGNGSCTVTYKGYDVTVDTTTGEVTSVVKAGQTPPTPPAGDYNTGKTVAEAIEQDKPYENNTTITDEFGNEVKVPAGFKVVKDNPTDQTPSVKDGIVIQDATYEGTIGSEFVWIPVGDIKISETETVTINLSRYTFDSEGKETDQGANGILGYTEDTLESHNADYKNAIATDIEDFRLKASAERSGGYYIGRYEARVDDYDTSSINRYNTENKENWTGYKAQSGKELKLVTKPDSQVWNYVTQNKASELSRNMYTGKTFTSDLMNSYAWDTAVLFIQKVTNENYANQNNLNRDNIANQGTNSLTESSKQDKICNIWDMAGNCSELTTETSGPKWYGGADGEYIYPCVIRGGYHFSGIVFTINRENLYLSVCDEEFTFRPLLYL